MKVSNEASSLVLPQQNPNPARRTTQFTKH